MNMNKIVGALLVAVGFTAVGVVSVSAGTNGFFASLGGEYEYEWHHYAETQGTEVTIGNKEYWIQCGTNTVSFETPVGNVVDVDGGADTSGYAFHDERFTTNPKEYVFSYGETTNMVGAQIYIEDDSDDKSWMFNGNVDSKKISYKTYAAGKAFRNRLPLVNFNYYEEVTMDLKTTIYNEGYKFGFDNDVATTGFAPEISVKEGGKITLVRINDTTVRMIINHPNANMNITHDFVGAEYVNGTASTYFYTYATGDAFFEISNWTTTYSHTHSYTETSSTDCLAAVVKTCSGCGDVVKTAPTYDFTTNTYGACAYNYTASSDYATQLIEKEANKLSYKSYDLDSVFSFTMPKIKFSDFATTTITVSATQWYERMGFGFTQEQAATRENHTTYGGQKDGGSLTFTWNDDVLSVRFIFEYVDISTTITDADVISGAKGFSLYITSGYNRYLDFSNFTFTVK